MTGRAPDFVVIGAQKAASTLLQASLRQHPQVWLPPRGEDPYFRDPVYDPARFDRFTAQYAPRTERRVGIKCPDYLGRPEVPARLRRDLFVPDLIVCLRDPVQRALSAYFWWLRWGMIPLEAPEQGLRKILDGVHDAEAHVVAPILEWGRYGEHVGRYLEHFPREKLLVLLDDDLRRDATTTIRTTYEFLGVDPGAAPASVATRDNAGVYAMPRLRFLNLRSRYMLQWDEHRTFSAIHKPANPASRLYCNAVATVDRYLLSRVYGNAKPTLSAELTGRLHDYYRDDLHRLEDLIGRDLSAWRHREPRPETHSSGKA